MWEDLLPNQYHVPIDETMIQRMKDISLNYSKSRNKKDTTFETDGEQKRKSASPEVVAAAETYAGEVYTTLKALSGVGRRTR